MKRLFVLLLLIFPCIVRAVTVNWHVDDELLTQTTCTAGGNVVPPAAPAKYGYTFQRWIGICPGTIPLEYIESNGAQYIDTGFKPNQNTTVIMEYMMPGRNNSGFFTIFARNGAWGQGGASFSEAFQADGIYRSDFGTSFIEGGSISNAFFGNKLILEKNKNHTVLRNGGTRLIDIIHSDSNFQLNSNMVFPSGSATIKIYSFELYNNDAIVYQFVPVRRETDNKIGMCDLVSGTFFLNAGTGDFIAGPTINEQ